jgi:hypothetical protein
MKYISYSLFGFGEKTPENCFEFNSYLRGFWINVRLAKVLYPDWRVHLCTDHDTYNHFEELFNEMRNFGVEFMVLDKQPLCLSMLWRILPIFDADCEKILCRDADSPLTYREAQMVLEWERTGKIVHAITDSVSHNIPMMGGMIGFTKHFTNHFNSFGSIIESRDYSVKGSDQDTLNNRIYPSFSHPGNDSIVQHYILGMGNTFLSSYTNTYDNSPLPNVNDIYVRTNDTCGHIGAAGYYEAPTLKFLKGYDENKGLYEEFEKKYSNIFYWANE